MSSRPTLDITHPHLAEEWHPDNIKSPSDVTTGSKYRATWLCPKDGHVWEALVQNRTGNGSGCPLCANHVVRPGYNDLATKFPHLADEWHPSNSKRADQVSPGAGYRATWMCSEGHTWEIPVCSRTGDVSKSGCPVCSGKKVSKGVNDLGTTHPHLISEWSPLNSLRIDEVSAGSKKRVKWVCAQGHSWETTVSSRVGQGTGCGKCSGRHVDEGVNDLATLRPEIATEWSPHNLKPAREYTPGSSHVAEWKCALGHTWRTSIANRTLQGTGCPTCKNKVVLKGFNDLATLHPDIAAQWHPDNPLTPYEVGEGSSVKVLWVCSFGHEWKALVTSRVHGSDCPYCSGRLPVPGVTDVATTHPHLIPEWAPSNQFSLSDVSSGSDTRGDWVCSKGHTWSTQIKHRALRGQGCPECSRTTFSSRGEKELSEFIATIVGEDNIRTTYRGIPSAGEVDIYIPTRNIAFEFNGIYYHSDALGRDKDSHYKKFAACKRSGVQLVAVWEDDWRDRREVVERTVSAKLGVTPRFPGGARKLTLDTQVPQVESDALLSGFHVQGPSIGSVYVGFRDDCGMLHAVAVCTVRKGSLVIDRYAARASIAGGFARIITALVQIARKRGCATIVTYSDNSISDGSIYARTGFLSSADVPPKYGVVWKGSRHHVSSLKRSKFLNDPYLKYEEGTRLVDLYTLNGMHRYWDYGKVRWELTV